MKKSDTKDYVFYGFKYMKFQEKAILWRPKSVQ